MYKMSTGRGEREHKEKAVLVLNYQTMKMYREWR
jgi:hypothetical protein